MKIKVQFFAHLRLARGKEASLDIKEDMIISDIVTILDLHKEELGIILINGLPGGENSKLKDGDVISFFPFVAGG